MNRKRSKMKTEDMFSIIIPMHNAQEFILDALNSLEIQETKNFECLIIDDHSSDKSKKIVKNYQKKANFSIQLYETENEKWGPGAARNIGLSHAKGKYILFLDADDQLKDKNVVKKITEAIKKERNAEIILLGKKKVWYNYNGKIVKEKEYFPRPKQKEKSYQIGRNNEGIIWSYCWKKELFIKHKIQFPENTIWEDFIPKILLFSHANQENIIHLSYITHQYNIRPGKSIGTTPTLTKVKALIKIYHKCSHLIKEEKIEKKYRKELFWKMMQLPCVLGWMLNRAIIMKLLYLRRKRK